MEAEAEAARPWEPAEETLGQLRGSSRAAPGRVEGRGPCLRAQGGRLLFVQSGWGTGCTRVSQNSPELPEPAEMGGEVCVPGPLRPGPGRVRGAGASSRHQKAAGPIHSQGTYGCGFDPWSR